MSNFLTMNSGGVGNIIFRRDRKTTSDLFPYWLLSNPSQVLNSLNYPDYVSHLRSLKPEVSFSVSSTLPGNYASSPSTNMIRMSTAHGLNSTHVGRWLGVRMSTGDVQFRLIVRIDNTTDILVDESLSPNSEIIDLLDHNTPTSVFSGSWSTNIFTLTDNSVNRTFINALWEDFAFGFNGSASGGTLPYAEWAMVLRHQTTEQNITEINVANRQITVGSNGGGTSIEIYPHRIIGSSTTARHRQILDVHLGSGGLELVTNFRRRDRLQGHRAEIQYRPGNAFGGSQLHPQGDPSFGIASYTVPLVSDRINGSPRIDQFTQPRTLGIYVYEYVGRVI